MDNITNKRFSDCSNMIKLTSSWIIDLSTCHSSINGSPTSVTNCAPNPIDTQLNSSYEWFNTIHKPNRAMRTVVRDNPKI